MAEQTDSVHHCVGERQWNQIMQITPTAYFLQEFVYHLTFNTNLPFWQFFFFFLPPTPTPSMGHGWDCAWFLVWMKAEKKKKHAHTHHVPAAKKMSNVSEHEPIVCVCVQRNDVHVVTTSTHGHNVQSVTWNHAANCQTFKQLSPATGGKHIDTPSFVLKEHSWVVPDAWTLTHTRVAGGALKLIQAD